MSAVELEDNNTSNPASLSPSPMDSPLGPTGSSPADVLSPVGSPPSDDDRDHCGGAGEHGQAATVALTEDLKRRIMKQVEYYFSDENLATDKHMISLIKKKKEGFVPISVIGSFRKMKRLIRDSASVATALRDSSFLVVSSDGKMVRRLNPVRDPKHSTVLVENLPEDHSLPNIRSIFAQAGNITNVSIRDPHTTIDKGDKFINSNKLHALVEYETVEAAEKAVATLNNEHDWRSGLRVKLLKNMVQRGQKKQVWRDHSDSEKNLVNRLPERLGEEGNDNSTEHHDETRDEENGAHSHKEKNEQRSRNRGRSGRQKHHGGANGMGHGTTRSVHSHEPPKPPPGPRMPDGTKGFTMGRGRVTGSL